MSAVAPPRAADGAESPVHPRVLMAIAAIAALFAALLPTGGDGPSLRFWWTDHPALGLGGVASLMAAPILAVASTLHDGRGAAFLGAALCMLAAFLAALPAWSATGAPLLAASALALVPCAAVAAAPRGWTAPVPDRRCLAAGIALGLLAVGDGITRFVGLVPGVEATAPAIVAVVGALAIGVAALVSGTARRGSAVGRPVLGPLLLGAALAPVSVVAALLAGSRSDALAVARVVMLAATASALLGALTVRARRPGFPRSGDSHGPR